MMMSSRENVSHAAGPLVLGAIIQFTQIGRLAMHICVSGLDHGYLDDGLCPFGAKTLPELKFQLHPQEQLSVEIVEI